MTNSTNGNFTVKRRYFYCPPNQPPNIFSHPYGNHITNFNMDTT